jgi:hypothetical protein
MIPSASVDYIDTGGSMAPRINMNQCPDKELGESAMVGNRVRETMSSITLIHIPL